MTHISLHEILSFYNKIHHNNKFTNSHYNLMYNFKYYQLD